MYAQLIGTNGRIGRLGFLARILLLYATLAVGLAFIGFGSGVGGLGGVILILTGILVFISAIPGIFCAVMRRMHDFGWGGWQVVWAYIPYVNVVIMIMLLIRRGNYGNNEHGAIPNGLSVSTDWD